jgi:hypothetical protein
LAEDRKLSIRSSPPQDQRKNRRLAPVTRCRPCLSRGCCPCGALYAGDPAAIGFTHGALRACFHARLSALFTNRFLRTSERIPGHSPLRPTPPQSSFDSAAVFAFRQKHRPARVSALFATRLQCVHSHGGSQIPALFRPQVITTSRRFSPLCSS